MLQWLELELELEMELELLEAGDAVDEEETARAATPGMAVPAGTEAVPCPQVTAPLS